MFRPLLVVFGVVALAACGASAGDGEPTDDVEGREMDLAAGTEIGIISDLDDTLIPKANPDLSKPAQPGIAQLYDVLEHRKNGKDGDVYYVTARKPERVKDVPAYLEANGIPGGPIETGTSGAPFIARPEKVKDIEAILAKTGAQKFVFFGDTSSVDVEVQQDILKKHPERVAAGIILQTTATFDASKLVDGQHLVTNYGEAASVLRELGLLNRTEEKKVIRAAHAPE